MISIAWLIPVKTIQIKYSYIQSLLTKLSENLTDTYTHNFYLGFDRIPEDIYILKKFNKLNFTIYPIKFNNIPVGYLTKMWNHLFSISYENNDYFFQCGDDVEFLEYEFIDKFVNCLQKNNNIGITGYYQLNDSKYPLLTQTFVSKKHMDIFGFYFPEQLKNWYCDDWINQVYKKTNKYFPLLNSKIINKQTNQKARYSIPKLQTTRINLKKICDYLVDKHVCILKNFLKNKN